MHRAPALTFDGVTRRYADTIAVDAVSLAVAAGSFVALVGASGSGKSTLLKTVNRLVLPDAGRVLLDGGDVADRPAHQLRRAIGYVFQNVGLFPHMTVAENIAIGPRIDGAAAPDVTALLALVDLPATLSARMPDALSGGQRQRIGVARALAREPGLLLMDEPFGALDPVTRDALGAKVRALHDRLGLTTLMVTHDMAEAMLLADRIVVMRGGRIVADADPADFAAGRAGEEAEELAAVARRQAERLHELARR